MSLFGPPNIEKMEANRNVKGLIKVLEWEDNSQLVEKAVEALVRIGDTTAIAPLIRIFKNEDVENIVRRKAAEVLGRLKDPHAVGPLIEALDSWNSVVCEAAAEALRHLKGLAVEPLINIINNHDSNSDVRQVAVKVLGQIKDPRAVEPLIKVLSNHDNPGLTREAAAEALGQIKDSRAVDTLIKELSDSFSTLRQSAAKALGQIKDIRAVEPLIKALDDTDHYDYDRKAVVKALGQLKDPRAVEPLIREIFHNYLGKYSTIEALSLLGETSWKNIIIGDNDDPDRLGKSKDPRVVEPLIEELLKENSYKGFGKVLAARALGILGDPRAIEPLIQSLDDKDGDVRSVVSKSLGQLKDLRAVEPLIKVLADGTTEVRKNAAEALGQLKDLRAVEPLIKALADGTAEVRKNAAEALFLLGETTWKELVKGENEDFQRLGKSKDPRAVEPLLRALADGTKNIRKNAAEALGQLKDCRAVEPLMTLLWDYKDVRKEAAEALLLLGETTWKELVRGENGDFERLGKSRGRRAVEPLIKVLQNQYLDMEIRREAARAIVSLFKTGTLEEQYNKLILSSRDIITEGHTDIPAAPGPYCGDTGTPHSDYEGIGVDFPL